MWVIGREGRGCGEDGWRWVTVVGWRRAVAWSYRMFSLGAIIC